MTPVISAGDLVGRLQAEAVCISDTLSAPLLSEAAARILELETALNRQCDNMAFVVNHANLYSWYDKFSKELEEDRSALQNGGAER